MDWPRKWATCQATDRKDNHEARQPTQISQTGPAGRRDAAAGLRQRMAGCARAPTELPQPAHRREPRPALLGTGRLRSSRARRNQSRPARLPHRPGGGHRYPLAGPARSRQGPARHRRAVPGLFRLPLSCHQPHAVGTLLRRRQAQPAYGRQSHRHPHPRRGAGRPAQDRARAARRRRRLLPRIRLRAPGRRTRADLGRLGRTMPFRPQSFDVGPRIEDRSLGTDACPTTFSCNRVKPCPDPAGRIGPTCMPRRTVMTPTRDPRPAAYLIILLGLGLAAAASLVPFYHVAYLLEPGILLAVLMPFLLYGLFIESLRGSWLLATGLLLLAANLVLVAFERYLRYDGYTDDLIYWVPTLAAVLVLTIAYRLGRRTDEADPSGTSSPV